MRIRRIAAATMAAAMGLGGALIALPAAAEAIAPTVAINEVDSNGDPEDWVELYNYGASPVDLSGMFLRDNKDDDPDHLEFPDGTLLRAGEYLLLDKSDFLFGIGKDDTIRLFDADGTTLIDSVHWTEHAATTYARCSDGTGTWVVSDAKTPGAANDCTPAAPSVVLNEIESQGDPDWVELYHNGVVTAVLDGLYLRDNKDGDNDHLVFDGASLEPGEFLLLDGNDFAFGIGSDDTIRLLAADDSTVIDSFTLPSHATETWGRCADGEGGVGALVETTTETPGAANDCTTPGGDDDATDPAEVDLVFNEIESNGDDTDWVEVMNLGEVAVNLSGYIFKDDNDGNSYALPTGTMIDAGGLLVIDQKSATQAGFDFGLGDPDEPRLFGPDGTTLVASAPYDAHAAITWALCADGVGDLQQSTVSTKGEPNDCSAPIRINEIESKDAGDGADWIELTNIGIDTVDLTGMMITDSSIDHLYTFGAVSLEPGEFLVIIEYDETDFPEGDFDFGLGGGDTVTLYAADETVLDTYSWTEHASTTYGRCPDGKGEFDTTLTPTPGAANECAGIVNASPWPGGADVDTLDAEPTFSGDMSGIDYLDGELWAVQNGDGLLYRMTPDGTVTGEWTLTYPGGTGTVDSEGVHAAGDGVVYVSSERNNDASSTSRPAVLRYEVTGASGTLVATDEWNLAADFPGLGANQGLEGITHVPDAWITDGGLVDEGTGLAYNPADYAGHGDGLYVVGVEGTAAAYAYALMPGGAFARVATVSTEAVAFSLVADVQFDSERELLWVVCDEACDGRIATYEITGGVLTATALHERPAGMANIANEGFAVADSALCVDGSVPTFYVDDADTDGLSLRSGTLPCTATPLPETGPGISAPGSAAQGATITITVGKGHAGTKVTVELHSTPVVIGTPTVGADGTVTVVIPASTEVGSHTLYVYDASGALIGTAPITIVAAELPQTGGEATGLALALALALAGAGALVARRRLQV